MKSNDLQPDKTTTTTIDDGFAIVPNILQPAKCFSTSDKAIITVCLGVHNIENKDGSPFTLSIPFLSKQTNLSPRTISRRVEKLTRLKVLKLYGYLIYENTRAKVEYPIYTFDAQVVNSLLSVKDKYSINRIPNTIDKSLMDKMSVNGDTINIDSPAYSKSLMDTLSDKMSDKSPCTSNIDKSKIVVQSQTENAKDNRTATTENIDGKKADEIFCGYIQPVADAGVFVSGSNYQCATPPANADAVSDIISQSVQPSASEANNIQFGSAVPTYSAESSPVAVQCHEVSPDSFEPDIDEAISLKVSDKVSVSPSARRQDIIVKQLNTRLGANFIKDGPMGSKWDKYNICAYDTTLRIILITCDTWDYLTKPQSQKLCADLYKKHWQVAFWIGENQKCYVMKPIKKV